MPRYDLELVKQAAVGRWGEIISSIGNVSPSVLDGGHHACPKSCHPDAGGKDRFRAMDDFHSTGALFCNQCFSAKNGDGFAALMWLTGDDFGKTLERVAKHLGIKADKGRKKAEPADHLEWLPWNRTAAHLWCLKKQPIKVESLERLGARYARYRKHYTVIAIPVWGPQLDAEPAVGWIIYRSDGGELPKFARKGAVLEWRKVLLTTGSQKGIVTFLDDWKKIGADAAPETWWKLEGSTDLLAAMSQDWPVGHAFFTTANGAGEKPLDWILKSLEGCTVNVCHDADRPGQQGATWVEQGQSKRPGWCPALAVHSKAVRNVNLPFEIEAVHGPDIRDFFGGGGVPSRLIELANASEDWAKKEIDKKEVGVLVIDNNADMGVRLRAMTDMLYATKRIYRRDHDLVSFDANYHPRQRGIESAEGFAGFISECFETRNADGKPLLSFPKPLATTWLNNEQEHDRLEMIELLTLIPVYDRDWNLTKPGLSNGIYYSGVEIEPVDGTQCLDEMLADFCFHSPADQTNFIGMLLTCVLMPHFALVEKPGVLLNGNQPGIGKSELAQVLATIKQGADTETCTYNPNDEEFEKSLGSLIDNKSNTTIVIDNVKSRKKIESACLERSITDSTLSFRRLKTSDRIKMRNTHIFVITANATDVSTDISSRCTLVGLHHEGDPKSRKFGLQSPKRYAAEHRERIIGELLGMVERWLAAGKPMGSQPSRFATWAKLVGGILEHNGEPDFLGNVSELNELDSTQAEFADLVRAMYESPTAGNWQANEMLELCDKHDLLKSAVVGRTLRGKQTSLGQVAGRFKDMIFDVDGVPVQFKVLRDGRITRYRVVDTSDSGNYSQNELLVD